MGFLAHGWLFLALIQGLACSGATSNPTPPTGGFFEVDLIFPRNETFAPSSLTPFVFAVKNPVLIDNLDGRIVWTLEQQNVPENQSIPMRWSAQDLWTIDNSSDPAFVHWGFDKLNKEGTFLLNWRLEINNCSYLHEHVIGHDPMFYSFRSHHEIHFTIKDGASPPDLVAATADHTCHQTSAVALNIPALVDIGVAYAGPTCAKNPELLTPSPCEIKVDSKAASSISAAMASSTNWICETGTPCMPFADEPSSGHTLNFGTWTMGISALLVVFRFA